MKLNKKKEKDFIWRCSGSYTLEAALVMPLILGIIFVWMFELFYFHDRVVLDGIMQRQLIKKIENMQEAEKEEVQKAHIQKELEEKLWVLEIYSLEERESFGINKYMARVKTTWEIPVMKYYLNGRLDFQEKWSCYSVQPDYLLRLQK